MTRSAIRICIRWLLVPAAITYQSKGCPKDRMCIAENYSVAVQIEAKKL